MTGATMTASLGPTEPAPAASAAEDPAAVVASLRAMGHAISFGRSDQFGGSQAIIKLSRGYVAGSDPRKDGHAAGY